MSISNSTAADLDAIFNLYDQGTEYQKQVAKKHWKGFDRALVLQEIEEQRQWKITIEGEIACVFCVTFNDPEIWGEKDRDPAIYLHRIATHPKYRGRGFVKSIADWAQEYARPEKLKYIRLDTGSGNDRLNAYYMSCGFTYLGIKEVADTTNLPEHYKTGASSLFEMAVTQ